MSFEWESSGFAVLRFCRLMYSRTWARAHTRTVRHAIETKHSTRQTDKIKEIGKVCCVQFRQHSIQMAWQTNQTSKISVDLSVAPFSPIHTNSAVSLGSHLRWCMKKSCASQNRNGHISFGGAFFLFTRANIFWLPADAVELAVRKAFNYRFCIGAIPVRWYFQTHIPLFSTIASVDGEKTWFCWQTERMADGGSVRQTMERVGQNDRSRPANN